MSYYVHLLVIWFTCIAHCCLHCCRSSHLPMCQSASVKSIIPMTERCFFFFSGWTRLGLSPRDTQEWTIWWGNWWEAMGVQWCVLLSDKPHLKISQALSSYNPMYRKFCRKLAFHNLYLSTENHPQKKHDTAGAREHRWRLSQLQRPGSAEWR